MDDLAFAGRRLPDNGWSVALLLAAGFAVRAATQLTAIEAPAVRQGLDALLVLLYCLGFAYALAGLFSRGCPIWLHLGALGSIAGAALAGLLQDSTIGRVACLAGAGLLAATFVQFARREATGCGRLALLVAAASPILFALHVFRFPDGGDALPARFLRLGATAALALPLLATLYRLDHRGAPTRWTRVARTLLAIGMVAMPLALVLAAFVDERIKYALAPASDCLTIALIIACAQAWRRGSLATLAGYGTLLGSMLLGKVMGFYAFGAEWAPALVAAYGDAWRVAVRHFHIDAMVIGYVFLIWPALVRRSVAMVASLALALGLATPAMGTWSRLAGVAGVLWVLAFWRRRAAE